MNILSSLLKFIGENIEKTTIKRKTFNFTNLAQYSTSGYYLGIGGIKEKAGLPSDAKIISVNIAGWNGLGTTPNVQLFDDDYITVFFTQGTTITSESRINVMFTYVQ